MDVMFQRWLRNSLLCRSEQPVSRAADPQVVRECAVGLRMRPVESRVNLGPGAPMRMTGPNNLSLEFNQPAEKALLAMLAQEAPARVPFSAADARREPAFGTGAIASHRIRARCLRHAFPALHP